MSSDVLSKMDSNYILLENVTNKKYAKKILVSFLTGIKFDKSINETDYDTIFEELSKTDVASEIAKYALICSCQQKEELRYPSFVELKKQLLFHNVSPDEVIKYLDGNKELYIKVINDFVALRYNSKEHIQIDYDVNDTEVKKYIKFLGTDKEYKEKHSVFGKIANMLFNRSRFDVISNSQIKINKKKYSLGNSLFAFIDKGEKPFYQEDAVLLLKHPDNRDFKMIAVADGDGSKINGSQASNYALNELLKWFESKSSRYYNSVEEMKELLESELNKISDHLSNDHYGGATTIAVAIIGKYSTLISTVGDSKIMLIKDNKIVDETRDDSYVQCLCEKGLVNPKIAKFHKSIDFLTDELGAMSDKEVISNNTKVIPNDYDKLLVLTDGVTRLVNNDKIETVLRNNKDRDIVAKLVEASKKDVLIDEVDQYSNCVIKAGHKNTTAAMYLKRR